MGPAPKHRESLINAAMTLFRKQGYAGTGLSEILATSGAPKGSLYHYFPDGKEAIGEAALHLATEYSSQYLTALIDESANPAAMLLAYGERTAAHMEATSFHEGCPIATIALETTPDSRRLCAASANAFNLWSRALARMLIRAGHTETRAHELGDFIVASFEGALILARVRQDSTPIRTIATELARLVTTELNPERPLQ